MNIIKSIFIRAIEDNLILTNGDAFWLSIEATTTEGFGDVFPKTLMGRILTIICCIMGTCVYSLFILSI